MRIIILYLIRVLCQGWFTEESKVSRYFNAGAFAVYDALFGRGDGTIFLDQVVCSGNESRLFNCRHRGVGVHATFCTPASDAGVVCPGKLIMSCDIIRQNACHL